MSSTGVGVRSGNTRKQASAIGAATVRVIGGMGLPPSAMNVTAVRGGIGGMGLPPSATNFTAVRGGIGGMGLPPSASNEGTPHGSSFRALSQTGFANTSDGRMTGNKTKGLGTFIG